METSSSDEELVDLPRTIDMVLQIGTPNEPKTFFIESVGQPHLVFSRESVILLEPLVSYLTSLGHCLENTAIWFYSALDKTNYFCGAVPLPPNAGVPVTKLENFALILMCFKCTQETDIFPHERATYKLQSFQTIEGRKSKERKIGLIQDKVKEWRGLYNGFVDHSGETIRITLEEAAVRVGISKKTLDDYQWQLRRGEQFGFNFDKHRDEKVGVLRAYVKRVRWVQTMLAKPNFTLTAELKEVINTPGTPVCQDLSCCRPDFLLSVLNT